MFPLSVAKGHRYLEDASGRPFLMTGDAAWSLIGDLSREEADTYLADRQQRGFNTILVSLIEHRFSRNAPRNFYKHAPFREGGAFSNPNDAYFDDADWILRRAAERGFLVLLVPSYLGVNGGPEGWFHEVEAAGAGAMRSYGRYLGKRYRDFSNIVWVQGGDYDTPDKSLVEALAEGMAEVDPKALQTIHRGPETVGSEIWHDADWLKLDTLYAYQDVAARAEKRHLDGPALPFVFLEGPYENERGSDEQSLRANAYGAILSGACGQVFGNNPVWHFGGPGLYEQSTSWQDSLASRGAQSMTHLKAFFSSLPWWTLEPDRGALLAQGSSPSEGLVASRSPGGDLAVVYSAGARHIVLKASGLPSSGQRARWFDPSSGRFSPAIANGPAKAGTIEYITPHERNSAGFSDWLLVVTGPR
ncbi:MAG: DUF4038 domain-containing protein [Phyllobacterium sp.]